MEKLELKFLHLRVCCHTLSCKFTESEHIIEKQSKLTTGYKTFYGLFFVTSDSVHEMSG